MLRTPRILRAFEYVDRADFVHDESVDHAYENRPLPIGFGQTISQPATVAFMLELLQPRENDMILDIGSGSGWTTALLGAIAGNSGRVIGIEILPDLVDMGRRNLEKYNLPGAEIRPAPGGIGLAEEAPFQRILVSAQGDELPVGLPDQLAVGGVLVIPISGSIYRIEKKSNYELRTQEYPGFVFVPLRT